MEQHEEACPELRPFDDPLEEAVVLMETAETRMDHVPKLTLVELFRRKLLVLVCIHTR